jgi:hypothetical protein
MHFIDQYFIIKQTLISQNRNYLTKDEYILLKKITYSIYNFIFDKFITDLIKKYEFDNHI